MSAHAPRCTEAPLQPRLHLPDAYYLPKSLRDTIQVTNPSVQSSKVQVVSLGATRLDIKGAQAP